MPGDVRLPSGEANKHLIRRCFSSLFRQALTNQRKRGFALPISKWITTGPMRDMCEDSLNYLKSLEIFRSDGIDTAWNYFVKAPDTQRMGQVFGLCVLGLYCKRNKI